jgi:hypothetical protein
MGHPGQGVLAPDAVDLCSGRFAQTGAVDPPLTTIGRGRFRLSKRLILLAAALEVVDVVIPAMVAQSSRWLIAS